MHELEFFAGFDWASRKHVACVVDGCGKVIGEREIDHNGTALSEFFDWLVSKTKAEPAHIGVAIETTHGPVVEGLLERGFAVYAINPKQLDRFRDRFTVAGAKDDSRDARVLADSLRTDTRAFRRLLADEPVVIELREWSRMRDELVEERTRLTNRVREQLWRYYPQALKLTGDLSEEWFIALWQCMPEPSKARKFRKAAVEGILRLHRIRRINADEVLAILREKPVAVSKGTVAAATAHIRSVIERLKLANSQIRTADKKLGELVDGLAQTSENEPGQSSEQRDVAILRSCPGLGRTLIATLLAEAFEPLRLRDYHALRSLAGAAPVTRRSGKSRIVLRRTACNKRLQNALFHWARVAVRCDTISKARYAELRARGHTHARALRTVGDRLLLVACTMLKRRTFYDPKHAGAANEPASSPTTQTPSLGSTKKAIPSSRPAVRQSAARKPRQGCEAPAKPARATRVLDEASTALQ
jgi:transposase